MTSGAFSEMQMSNAVRGEVTVRLRAVWLGATTLALGLFAAGLPYQYRRFLDLHGPDPYGDSPARVRAGLHAAGVSARTYADLVLTLDLLLAAAFVGIAAVVFVRLGRDRWTLAFSYALVAFGTTFALVPQALADAHHVWRAPVAVLQLVGLAGGLGALLLFPDGRAVPSWTAAVIPVYAVWEALRLASWHALDPTAPLVAAAVVIALVVAQRRRYLRAAPVERQQTKVAVLGLAAAMLGFLAFGYVVPAVAPGSDDPGSLAALALTALLFASLLVVPAALAVALLRYRLWDVDLVVNRSLVYGGLTACVAGIYALVVSALGSAVGVHGLWPSLVATAAVALALNPLRTRLQLGVNRLLYGRRDEPLAVLHELGRRLEHAAEPDDLLLSVVEGVRETLGLSYAAVALTADDGGELLFESGTPRGSLVALPLVHRGLRQGELRAAPRAGEDDVHPRDRDLLERIASQAAASAHGIRLDLQLQRSRERIVTAREEERRRLRRDLHDGLGPSLASLRLKLTALRRTLPADPDAARRIDELRDDLGTLVGDVRGLVYGLRPPALDDLGLTDALRELAYELERAGLDVSVAAEPVELPAAAEVAVYRIAQEALANVLRHAQAGRCELAVTISDGQVRVTVSDDGVGVPEKPKLGVGLRSMEERATELGGSFELVRLEPGCRIVATLPLEVRDG